MVEAYGTLSAHGPVPRAPSWRRSAQWVLRGAAVCGVVAVVVVCLVALNRGEPVELEGRGHGSEVYHANAPKHLSPTERIKNEADKRSAKLRDVLKKKEALLDKARKKLELASRRVSDAQKNYGDVQKQQSELEAKQNVASKAELAAQVKAETLVNNADELRVRSREKFREAKSDHADALRRAKQAEKAKLHAQDVARRLKLQQHKFQRLQKESTDALHQARQDRRQRRELVDKASVLFHRTAPKLAEQAAAATRRAKVELRESMAENGKAQKLELEAKNLMHMQRLMQKHSSSLLDKAKSDVLAAASDDDEANSAARDEYNALHTPQKKQTVQLQEAAATDPSSDSNPVALTAHSEELDGAGGDSGGNVLSNARTGLSDYDYGNVQGEDTGGPMQALDDDNDGIVALDDASSSASVSSSSDASSAPAPAPAKARAGALAEQEQEAQQRLQSQISKIGSEYLDAQKNNFGDYGDAAPQI